MRLHANLRVIAAIEIEIAMAMAMAMAMGRTSKFLAGIFV